MSEKEDFWGGKPPINTRFSEEELRLVITTCKKSAPFPFSYYVGNINLFYELKELIKENERREPKYGDTATIIMPNDEITRWEYTEIGWVQLSQVIRR